MSRGRSLRSIHFIWFLTTWVTVENSSKCVLVLISMLGRVKNSHYSSCFKKLKSSIHLPQSATESFSLREERWGKIRTILLTKYTKRKLEDHRFLFIGKKHCCIYTIPQQNLPKLHQIRVESSLSDRAISKHRRLGMANYVSEYKRGVSKCRC